MDSAKLMNALAEDVQPVRRLRPPFVRVVAWLLLSSFWVALIVVAMGVRTDLDARLVDARWLIEQAYEWMFVRTGLADWMRESSERASAPSHGGERDFRYYLAQVYVWSESYLIAAAFTVLVFIVRVLVLVLTLPLFLLAAFVGLVDGLVRRDIRRMGAGRESGFIYHRAKASLMPLAVLPWITYLALPVSLSPLWILLPSAILLGVAVDIAAGSFKKYL